MMPDKKHFESRLKSSETPILFVQPRAQIEFTSGFGKPS